MKKIFLTFLFFVSLQVAGQDTDSEIEKLTSYIQTLRTFSRSIPQEKVYLHFDNTNYFQGDDIWFKCYVVTSGEHQLSQLSKTLYVELLNPGGEIIDKRILRVENGQCHGDFTLNHLPFYSGFYEVRAYTKYMLNFGEEAVFSRILPVFDRPKTAGAYEDKTMFPYDGYRRNGSYPMKREKPLKGDKVNMRFYPEGGNLIQGVESRVAFEATDESGNPIEVTGIVLNGSGQELCTVATQHEGRGLFSYTPEAGTRKEKDIAEIAYNGRKYRFDLPTGLPQGIVMEVDNMSYPDSIGVTLRKNTNTPEAMYGVVVLNGGKLRSYCIAQMDNNTVNLKLDKSKIPSGVSQVVLFNSMGEPLCDRLIFTRSYDFLDVQVKTNKPVYLPYELAGIELSVTDRYANPVQTTFSVSVRDAADGIENNRSILTDLLLMSEIKGYVRNPSYYFKDDDDTHSSALDLLLMVQGWRRYSWQQMAGIENLEIKYLPEQGIATTGQIVSNYRQTPQPNVDVALLLLKRAEVVEIVEIEDMAEIAAIEEAEETMEEADNGLFETFVTDDKGRFAFVTDVVGKWNMTLKVSDKGKAKDHLIILDRVFSPEPGRYNYTDLQVRTTEKDGTEISEKEEGASGNTDNTEEDDFDFATYLAAYQDSLARLGIDIKSQLLPEVTINAKRNDLALDRLRDRSESVASIDVTSEYDNIYDRGNYVGNNIEALLLNMDGFHSEIVLVEDEGGTISDVREFLFYESIPVQFVINYKPMNDLMDNEDFLQTQFFRYQDINVSAIKTLYINISNDREKCTVFIETYPDEEVPAIAAKGVRKTWLDGYSAIKEYYSPNYASLPPQPDPDYRRTIYWNPLVATDATGHVRIQFYNNSISKNFNISAETITPFGIVGVYNPLSSPTILP